MLRTARRRIRSRDLVGYLYIAPNFLLMTLFVLVPVLSTFILAFTDWNLVSGWKGIDFVGLRNFQLMLHDEWFFRALRNNIVYALAVVSGSTAAGFIVANTIHEWLRAKQLFRLAFFLPNISNLVAVSVVWTLLYSKYGPIVEFLRRAGVNNPPTFLANRHWALPAIILMSIWINIGFCVLIYSAGLQGIPEQMHEAAKIDGASRRQRMWYITIPSLSGTTLFLAITQMLNSFKVFGQIQIMTEGGPMGATSVLAYNIYETAFGFYRFGYAASQSVVLFLIVLTITIVQFRYRRKNQL